MKREVNDTVHTIEGNDVYNLVKKPRKQKDR